MRDVNAAIEFDFEFVHLLQAFMQSFSFGVGADVFISFNGSRLAVSSDILTQINSELNVCLISLSKDT